LLVVDLGALFLVEVVLVDIELEQLLFLDHHLQLFKLVLVELLLHCK
jgi:hypothetical protein